MVVVVSILRLVLVAEGESLKAGEESVRFLVRLHSEAKEEV